MQKEFTDDKEENEVWGHTQDSIPEEHHYAPKRQLNYR